jgi:hypothetical protein
MTNLSRRDLLRGLACGAVVAGMPEPLLALEGLADGRARRPEPGRERLRAWVRALGEEGLLRDGVPLGRAAARVGELAAGSPYEAFMLEAYLKAGADPRRREPLALSLARFDCVTLVESCLAVARAAAGSREPSWDRFAREVERMRYRGGRRRGYASRLHYFSEWIADGARRGLVRDLGAELGGVRDPRPLRFMTAHRASYPALADDAVYEEIGRIERALDASPRFVVPAAGLGAVERRIETGDVLAFATSIGGLDVSHAAFAWRDGGGVLRVLHAPLSGGVVEVTAATLPEYVAAIRRCTGVLVARPLRG